MGAAIGQILGNAVGVAISPVPMIALILMLFSPAAARNSLAFLLGWVTGLAGVGLVVLAIGLDGGGDGEGTTGGILKILIGILFLALGLKQWRSRPRGDAEPQLPGWMSAVAGFGAAKALGVGLLLTVANPKNLGLTFAAASSIAASGLSTGEEIATLAVFVVLGSLTVAGPIAYYLVAGERAEQALSALRDWLTLNSSTVMTVLFVILGTKVLGDGLSLVV